MEKKTNKKIVFSVIFAIVAIILAYAFTVVYFFYISPNDISMRLKIFPLLSDESVGEQCTEAIVEMNFTAKADDATSDEENVVVFGVNVREDGYVISSFYEFDYYEIGTITAFSSSGGVFGGEIIFSDETLNLTVIKLTSSTGKAISLPYVAIYSSEVEEDVEIVSVQVGYKEASGSDVKFTSIESGFTYAESGGIYWYIDEGGNWIKYFNDDLILFYASGYASTDSGYGSFIFDRYGRLMGLFSFGSGTEYGFATTVSNINYVLSDVISTYEESQTAYSSEIVSALKGLSAEELYYHSEMGNDDNLGTKYFYFYGDEIAFTDSITNLLSDSVQDFANLSFKWFYLVEDFVYGNVTITADSVLTEIEVNGTATTITSHIDLVERLYGLNSGDVVKISYYSDYGNAIESTPVESVTFTI